MCAVMLQYSVPCLFLKYMKPDKLTKLSQQSHYTEDYYFDLCFANMTKRLLSF